jgi:hypothetical protein
LRDRDHDEDGVEELGDEIIVAQETAAHAPAPRAQVATDHPSVVIAPHPSGRVPTVPPLRRSERTEKTVVIRDRKSLERLRREASRHPRARKRSRARAIYLVGFAVLASLAAGTLLATIANSTSSEGAANPAASADPSTAASQPAPSQAAPEVVDLEDLPVERKKKKKSPNAD